MDQAELHKTLGSIETKVNDLHHAMFGNGQPGIKDRVKEIEDHMGHCAEHKAMINKAKAESKVDIKFVVMAIIAVAAVLKDIF